jgi:hypothetical protein
MTDDAKKEREAVLLPCPLCNAPADIIFNKVGGAFSSGMETPQPSAECTSCKLRTPIFRCDDWPSGRKSGTPTQKEAVAAVTALWNNRQPQTDALRIKLLEDAVIAVVEATRAYLPPDGIDAQECISRILEATDNPAINPVIFEIEDRAALKESK